jgi:glycosyltransferase involved in cell wall biosynthesis
MSITDGEQFYFYTRDDEFDRVMWTATDKRLYTEDWRSFLEAVEPDLVHFHHSLWLGYDMLRETRAVLPRAPIVYTLHEFLPICHHGGQMVRADTFELCDHASPRRCHRCFPKISMQTFFLRERFIKSAFDAVDMFIAPSEHARSTYVRWGIPPERIRHEDYGRISVSPLPDPPDAGRRKRIGYFGRLTPHKGVDVLLDSMKILERERAGVQLMLWGANLEFSPRPFQERIQQLVAETSESVRFAGRFDQAELPGLISAVDWVVVPSIWWETGPLSIHEAMMHRRPVICSDVGAMAERVKNGVNGLHFRVGDADGLADTIRRATTSPALWDEIHERLASPYPMDEHLEVIAALYEELLAREELASEPAA